MMHLVSNEFPCIAAIIAVTFQTKAGVFEAVKEPSNCAQRGHAHESTKEEADKSEL